ncbi:MAG: T9SS type A sorting domain-containing protein [Flavobacteriales bacterium]|nr:T9SS type A sorting domain-containing protein [Flavobacteriales bacterium]
MKNLFLFFLFISGTLSAQWNAQVSGTSQLLNSIQFLNSNLGYCAGDNGLLLKTTNGGANWVSVNANTGSPAALFTTPDTGYTYRGTEVAMTVNGGQNFSTVLVCTDGISALSFPSLSVGYAAGMNMMEDSIIIYKTTDAGVNWTYYSGIPASLMAYSIYFIDNNIGFVGGFYGGLYKTTDGGLNWNMVYNGTSGAFSFSFPNTLTGYAVTESGSMLKTVDGGDTWAETSTGAGPILYSIDCVNPSTCYAVGGDGFSSGTIIKTSNGGTSWTSSQSTLITYQMVDFLNDTVGYACGGNGSILRYGSSLTPNSVFETNPENQLQLYPNPAVDFIIVDNTTSSGNSIVEIYGIRGELIRTVSLRSAENRIDISNLTAGMYIVKVISDDKELFSKMIKQ